MDNDFQCLGQKKYLSALRETGKLLHLLPLLRPDRTYRPHGRDRSDRCDGSCRRTYGSHGSNRSHRDSGYSYCRNSYHGRTQYRSCCD